MIRRIHIKNFKSLVDVEVELSPVTVLIGKSGTGKSNFVDAIRLIRELLAGADPSPWNRMVSHGRLEEQIAIELELMIENFGQLQYTVIFDPDWKASEEKLSHDDQIVFHAVPKLDKHQKLNGQHWAHPPAISPHPQFGRLMLSKLTELPAARAAYVAWKDSLGIHSFSDHVLTAPSLKHGQRLDDDGSNFPFVLAFILKDLNAAHKKVMIDSVMSAVNPTIRSLELDDIQNPTQVLVERSRSGAMVRTSLTQESAGTRRFLAHLLALFQSPSLQTLIFEHPEDGIHPHALATLASQFNIAPEENRGQVILTTHSPQLLDHFAADQIRVVEMHDLETKIGKLAPDQFKSVEEKLLYPGELFTVDDARIGDSPVFTGAE